MSESRSPCKHTFLSFGLGRESFALEVSQVKEVLDLTRITRLPHMPDYVRGIINLRGKGIPVVDMRTKFGLEGAEDSIATCIIVVDLILEGKELTMGALVDKVEEVFELEDSNIDPPPDMGMQLSSAFIKGIGKRREDFIILLDAEKVFTSTDMILMLQRGLVDEPGAANSEIQANIV